MTPIRLAEIKERLEQHRCPTCAGTGVAGSAPCPECGGAVPQVVNITIGEVMELIDALELSWRGMGHRVRVYDRRLTESLKRHLSSPAGQHQGGFILEWDAAGRPTVDATNVQRIVDNEEALVDVLNVLKSRGTSWEELFPGGLP